MNEIRFAKEKNQTKLPGIFRDDLNFQPEGE